MTETPVERLFHRWMLRYFSNDEAVVLFVLLSLGLIVLLGFGSMLGPLIASMVVAFMLQGMVDWLCVKKIPHLVSVTIVFIIFIAVLMAIILLLLPLIWGQVTHFLNELPKMLIKTQSWFLQLPEVYPDLVSNRKIVDELFGSLSGHAAGMGQWLVSFSLARISTVVQVSIYLILVPILIFLFLKDYDKAVKWLGALLPKERNMMNQVANEMSFQIANYIRGKTIEIVIVSVVTFVAFLMLGLNYAALLALLVGISSLVPYIGAAIVSIPVLMVAIFQFGTGHEFIWVATVYMIILALDGNVLVPLLLGDAVNLHPIAIIAAVLLFGGIWGGWGVFFAIPLATFVKAIVSVWPVTYDTQNES